MDWMDSPIGPLLLGASISGLCRLEFTDSARLRAQLQDMREKSVVVPGRNAHIDQMKSELTEYFQGQRKSFGVPLITHGSSFEERVWTALRRIPYGQTRSYSELAGDIGSPEAVRAVGTANGRNPIAIVIPCHRVINKNRRLGGYGGGLWRKQHLLDLEYRVAGGDAILIY